MGDSRWWFSKSKIKNLKLINLKDEGPARKAQPVNFSVLKTGGKTVG
jgi:hypothetical protein